MEFFFTMWYRLMFPNWIPKNTVCNSEPAGDDLNLNIQTDSRPQENVFSIPLIPPAELEKSEDITVHVKIGSIFPRANGGVNPNDPMNFVITDHDFCVGMQLTDPDVSFSMFGPYRSLEAA